MTDPAAIARPASPVVAVAVEQAGTARELVSALELRGLSAAPTAGVPDALTTECAAIAFAPARPVDAATAASLAPLCARAAADDKPMLVLSAFEPAGKRGAAEREAALAYLASHGAIVCPDPNVWLEALVLCSAFGLPAGPSVAVVAPPGTWLALSATALANERAQLSRSTALVDSTESLAAVDIALVHANEMPQASAPAPTMLVPVTGGAAPRADAPVLPALFDLRNALAAAALCGRAQQRIAAGPGPCAVSDIDAAVDADRFDRQRDQLDTRAGDHETKVLLASYQVPITRQAVATTPSGATRLAKRAGWPVQVKPWSPEAPSEYEGCPVETGLDSAPEVRRAFASVTIAAGLPAGSPVIVRETPPAGRLARVRFLRLGPLGWTCLVDVDGRPGPGAAPAPLRGIDAERLALAVEATRSNDPPPDRDSFATLLRRASRLVVERGDDFESLDLARVVVGPADGDGPGAVVVDARAALRR